MNMGSKPEIFAINLSVGNEKLLTRDEALEPRETRTMSFPLCAVLPGIWIAEVNETQVSFTIVEEENDYQDEKPI